MKLKRIFTSAAVCAVALAMVVGGFISKSAQAQVTTKPSFAAGGGFRSYPFSATVATPYAQSGNDTDQTAVFEMTGDNAPARDTVLLGFSVFAATAGSTAGIFDEDLLNDMTTAALSRAKYIDEIGEATQYDTVYSDWPAPRKLERGLCIITDRAPCVVSVYMD